MKIANDGEVYGPVWLSKGERFRPTGAYAYLYSRYEEIEIQLKKLRKDYKEIMIILNEKHKKKSGTDDEQGTSDEEVAKIQDKSLLSMSKKEIKDSQKVNKKIISIKFKTNFFF